MNHILDCLETEAFNELINFSFTEVRELFKETIKHENGNETIEIEMDKKTYPLTFVEKHIEDIRSTLLVERK